MLKAAEEPAITSAPSELTADCTLRLAREKTMFWTPAGRPIRTMGLSMSMWMRRSRGSTWAGPSDRHRKRKRRAELIALEITVASATPLTVMPMTTTKKMFSTTLTRPEMVRQIRGVRVSPWLR